MNAKLILTEQQSMDIICNENDDYEVIEKKYTYQSRWHTHYDMIVKDLDGKFWRADYGQANGEGDNDFPTEWIQVEPKSKTIIEYVPVKG